MIEVLAGIMLLAGSSLNVLAALGVVRLPDVFTRMQSSTKAATLGLGCLLVALILLHPNADFALRAGSIMAFIMLTTPVAAHVIARAAAHTGAPLWIGTIVDERPVELEDDFAEDVGSGVEGGAEVGGGPTGGRPEAAGEV